MSNLYNDFEKRFTCEFFSSGWVEVDAKSQRVVHKDLSVLESELNQINEKIETISQKQLMLSNLAKLYNQ